MKTVRPFVLATVAGLLIAVPAAAIVTTAPPSFSSQELDGLVSRVALYPDPLLAQVMTASTYSDQIPSAARWADEHHYLSEERLSAAISADQLPWDASVQALLPFPSVLDQMSDDMRWTQQLGDAFLAQPNDVMDAVQRMRRRAADYGYLRSSSQVVVNTGPYIEILPVSPRYIVVPVYDPVIVYARPRPGFVVGTAIQFGFGVTIGTAFVPWGWGRSHFGWGAHTVYINDSPWRRTWVNRTTYVHHYDVPHYTRTTTVIEHHEVIRRTVRERDDEHHGRAVHEEHHARDDDHHKKHD